MSFCWVAADFMSVVGQLIDNMTHTHTHNTVRLCCLRIARFTWTLISFAAADQMELVVSPSCKSGPRPSQC